MAVTRIASDARRLATFTRKPDHGRGLKPKSSRWSTERRRSGEVARHKRPQYDDCPLPVRRGQVDIALVSVMRDAMLRRSEAAALRWVDVEFRHDGSARVTVRRSKGDQDATGATLYIGRSAAAHLQAIHRPDASPTARVFELRSGRAVSNTDRSGRDGRGVGRPLLGTLSAGWDGP